MSDQIIFSSADNVTMTVRFVSLFLLVNGFARSVFTFRDVPFLIRIARSCQVPRARGLGKALRARFEGCGARLERWVARTLRDGLRAP